MDPRNLHEKESNTDDWAYYHDSDLIEEPLSSRPDDTYHTKEVEARLPLGCDSEMFSDKKKNLSITSFFSMMKRSNILTDDIQDGIDGSKGEERRVNSVPSLSSCLPSSPVNCSPTPVNKNPNSSMRRSASFVHYDKEDFTLEELEMIDGDEILYDSNLLNHPRSYHIVTTASIPWLTGTAVNPLLRAVYLKKLNPMNEVTLVVPWLTEESDQKSLYSTPFKNPEEQETHIREWLKSNVSFDEDGPRFEIKIIFYEARYLPSFLSIFPMGDILDSIFTQNNDCLGEEEEREGDVCILEEPEHLNYFNVKMRESFPSSSSLSSLQSSSTPSSWRAKFKHVIGIIHTNYKAYAATSTSQSKLVADLLLSPVMGYMNSIVTRAHCHKIIKLSDVLQVFAPEKELVKNVHGIREEFLIEGRRRATELMTSKKETKLNNEASSKILSNVTKPMIYFIGKLVLAKGLDQLLKYQALYHEKHGEFFPIDIYGSGPDQKDIEQKYQQGVKVSSASSSDEVPLPAQFKGRVDHFDLRGDQYSIFVNPSTSEVLCTTTAEATAMGKFVILPKHPSNTFFESFPNCLFYDTPETFISQLDFAISESLSMSNKLIRSHLLPSPLSPLSSHPLSWEAATLRLIESAGISKREEARRIRLGRNKLDDRCATFWVSLSTRVVQMKMFKIFDPDVDQYSKT